MLKFVADLIDPDRGRLVLILLAMRVETLMSLAAPWPLKIILDSVVGNRKLEPWLRFFMGPGVEHSSKNAFCRNRRAQLRAHRDYRRSRLLY